MLNSTAHVPSETTVVLGTQRKRKVDKTHKIDMLNENHIDIANMILSLKNSPISSKTLAF